jgi:hypothetical protein
MPTKRKVGYDIKFVPMSERIQRIESKLDTVLELLDRIYGGLDGKT